MRSDKNDYTVRIGNSAVAERSMIGPYEIQSVIGHGGMATVYRAYQPSVDRDVAVKVISRGLAGDAQAVQRFQREARLVARLEHPYILPIYDFDGGHEPPYIVMRHLDGGTLKEILQRGPLGHSEITHLVRQVSLALDYAHRQGIVHRDIKPSNIMIDREGNAFVTDFGIARMVSRYVHDSDLTAPGSVVGTPEYMAPEQARGAEIIDHRADIYALGVILFQMLAGDLPFKGPFLDVLMQHAQSPVPSVVERNPELPAQLDEVMACALAKAPAQRFDSAIALSEAVLAVMGGHTAIIPVGLRQAAAATISLRRQDIKEPGSSSQTPSEQNKVVTALYASAAEYAEMVAGEDGSEAARRALQALWRAAESIAGDLGGHVSSRTEDTLLVLWGVDTAREDDAERAIRAALAMQAALREQARDMLQEDELLPLDIGLHTGLALLTPILDNASLGASLGASGTTISVSKRLAKNADGAILVTHDVYSQVRGAFGMVVDTPIRMRRNRVEIPVYRVLDARPRRFRVRARGVEGVETKMIGRDAELKALQNAFSDALEEQEIQALTIIGKPGLGKSRLLYEFTNWSNLRPEPFWLLRGRAMSGMTHRPYALLRDMLSFRYEILDNDSPALARQKLEAGIADQIGPDQEMAHLLGHLAGFDFASSRHIQPLLDDPRQLTNRARLLFQRWVRALCRARPVVMELEDLHHADDPSLDLLNDLIAENEQIPLLIVCLARPELFERRPAWGSGRRLHKRITLAPLDRRDSRRLVREILQKVEQVPKALRDLLVERAEGNPYYLEELIRMLITDRVVIKESDEVWRVEETRLDHLDVPATLGGLVQARLDSLLYPEKLTLQRAAVLGRVFYDQAVEALDRDDDVHVDDVPAVLERLAAREFIHARETSVIAGSTEYVFAGGMLREVLLSTLLRRQKEDYNRAAAEWLVQAGGERADEYLGLIADFYERAGDSEKAARCLQRAGERALALSSLGEARALLDRALALCDSRDPEVPWLRLRLGETYFSLGEYAAAAAHLDAVVVAARAQKAPDLAANAHYWSSRVAMYAGSYHKARAHLEQALPHARTGGDSVTVARVLGGLGELHWRLGELDHARDAYTESLELARQAGAATQELAALNGMGIVALSQGDLDDAVQYYEKTLIRAQEVGNRGGASNALNNLGDAARRRGDLAGSQAYLRQSLTLSRETGKPASVALALVNLALASVWLGQLDQARGYLHEGLTLSHRIGAMPWILAAVVNAGYLLARQGDTRRGLSFIGLVREHPVATPDQREDIDWILHALGFDPEGAEVAGELAGGASLELSAVVAELLDALAPRTEHAGVI